MDDAKVLAKVILITKDEHDLIGDFLEYYGTLFGRENVVVVDNGSPADSSVHAVYRDHVAAGGDVRIDARPFCDAVRFMSDHMRSLCTSCEFILPLETDEFLFIPGRDNKYTPTSHDVADILRAVPQDVSIIRYGSFYGSSVDPSDNGYSRGAYSRPVLQMTRFHDQGWDKIIVRASAFETMTQWCHHAKCSSGSRMVHVGLGLLHFHQTGLRRQVERSIPVITSYGYVDTTLTLGEQLTAVAPLVDAPIACGHKLNYYARHLRRRAALQSFRARIGRLPLSVSEMDEYAASKSPDDAVRSAITAGKLEVARPYASNDSMCWDDLLYHEPRMDGDIRCSQVRNFFAKNGTDTDIVTELNVSWVEMLPSGSRSILLVGRDTDVTDMAMAILAVLPAAAIDLLDTGTGPICYHGRGSFRRTRRLDPECPDSTRLLDGCYDAIVDTRNSAGASTLIRTMVNLYPLLVDCCDVEPRGTYVIFGTSCDDCDDAVRAVVKEGVRVEFVS